MVEKIGRMMERQTSQMSRLIDDLLDVSRITMGKIELRQEGVRVAEVIDAARESVQPLIEGAGPEVTLENAPGDWRIHGDPHRLAQVIANLLSNAAKYTPRRGKIHLWASREEGGKLLVEPVLWAEQTEGVLQGAARADRVVHQHQRPPSEDVHRVLPALRLIWRAAKLTQPATSRAAATATTRRSERDGWSWAATGSARAA